MISRKSAKLIGECYDKLFAYTSTSPAYCTIHYGALYDYLFDNNYSAWFCNQAKKLRGIRAIKEWIMRLHTAETLKSATPNWTFEQQRNFGQQYLRNLADDILRWYTKQANAQDKSDCCQMITVMQRQLELDGYIYRDGKLLFSEADVLDTKEEAGILQTLYTELALGNAETAMHHLKLSEEHYIAGRWDDAISNARKFFECVLSQIAIAHSLKVRKVDLPSTEADKPVMVREYLEREGLLETKEKKAIAEVYGLLSNTGSHPYVAQNDQARLLRQLALTLSQFAMLRFRGISKKQPSIV